MVVIVELVLAKSDDAHALFPFTCAVMSDYVRHYSLPVAPILTSAKQLGNKSSIRVVK